MSKRIFSGAITQEQAKDSGMALVLILLITGFIANRELFFILAAVALLINMIAPMAFYPFAVFWYGLSNLLGAVVSRIILVVIYALVLLPVALLRQLSGKDPLLLRKFKKGTESTLRSRRHHFTPDDLEKPF